MPFKSKLQQRYMEFMNSKGRLPKGVDLKEYEDSTDYGHLPEKKMFSGGEVDDHDEEEQFHDDDWNNHHDTDGEPEDDFKMHGYSFGGKVKADEHEQDVQGLHGKQYGKPNYSGPEGHDEDELEPSEHEIHRALAMSLMRRKQLRPGA